MSTTIITIDGPAGAGKSTVARALAKELNFSYLDTGAMYRALTYKALKHSINLEDEDALVDLAKDTTLDLKNLPEGVQVLLDGQDVSRTIRTLDVTNNTFYIARAPKVREIMVGWQRKIAGRHNVVVEGRDVGTVVFPDASYKFYLDADVRERSIRRFNELKESGKNVNLDELIKEVKERDEKDLTRETSPLRKAEDAILIDSTSLCASEVVGLILQHIKDKS